MKQKVESNNALKCIAKCLVLAVMTITLFLSGCAPFAEKPQEEITITLPPIGSSLRAIPESEIARLQAATASYRVTANQFTRIGTAMSYKFFFAAGTNVSVTVECLNASGQVIVRSVVKSILIKSGVENKVSFVLREDGTEIVPASGDTVGDTDTTEREKFAVTYELDGGEWSAASAQPETAHYAAGDTVTVTSNVPTKAGLMFAGWKPSAESLAPLGYLSKAAKFEMPAQAVTLTALWGQKPARTVLYDDGLFVMNELDVNARNVGVATEYPAMESDGSNYVFTGTADIPWYNERAEITSVEIGSLMFPVSTAYWFYNLQNCASIDLSLLDTSNVTTMRSMFSGCNSLTELDVSGFDTSNVTNMRAMFFGCQKLTSLNVSSFNTSKVTTMYQMFESCNSLTELDLSSFNTSKVTTMYCMFRNCYSLTELDLKSFDTSNVTSMYQMFGGGDRGLGVACTRLDLSNFDTSKVTTMQYMFLSCDKLTELNVSSFDTSNVTNMYSMFDGCNSLTELDVSGFDTSNVTNMQSMFYACSKLTTLDLSSFNTSQVTTMQNMFAGGLSLLTELDLSSFDTSKVTNMRQLFKECSTLMKIYVRDTFVTTKVTSISNHEKMFEGCTALVGGRGTVFDENNIDKTHARIDGGPNSDTPGYFTDIADKP